MLDQNERRIYARLEPSCPLTYKFPAAQQVFTGECINIGGAGIVFRSEQPVEPGLALEIHIAPDNSLKLALRAFAEVLRCSRSTANTYLIACEIKGIK